MKQKPEYAKAHENVLYPLKFFREDIFKLERALQKYEKLTRDQVEEILLRG